MTSLRLLSPAKLNFYLKVINKRPDGFHNIVTLFQRINLCDEMTFQPTADGKIVIECDHPDVPCDNKNLAYKAVLFLKEKYGISQGVKIHIKKRIPVAAGMAGGSSNAATTILGLNQLWKLKISRKKLVEYASEIGSDVAFFLYNASWALGTGRGEHIKPLTLKAKCWQAIVTPRAHVYAKDVYQGLKMPISSVKKGDKYLKNTGVTKHLTNNNDNVNILIHYLRQNDFHKAAQQLMNDLEAVVITICPQVKKVKQRLMSLKAHAVMVSGSGPSVFALMSGQKAAQEAKSVLQKQYQQVFVARTL